MMQRMLKPLSLLVIVVCCASMATLRAQSVTSSLSGTVVDVARRPLPRVQVAIRNLENGTAQTITTDAEGRFSAVLPSAGRYQVTASLAGFNARPTDLVVGANSQVTVDLVLQPVSAGASGTAGGSGGNTVREIPLNGRSATDVATLEPGVATTRTQLSGAAAQRGFGTQITISGGRPRQNDSRLDGISVNDYANGPPGSAAGVNLGVDAVEEVSVLSSNYPAQYGRSSGGIVSTSTRSGTNEFHGSIFEFFRNSALDARNFFDTRKPPFKRNQFGGTFGGPLWRKHTFVFGAYEGFRQSLGISQVSTVPSAAARSGKLSTGLITVDPQVLRFVNAFYPLPNGSILSSGDTGLFSFSGQQVIPDDYFTVRVDHNLSNKDLLSGTFMLDNATVRQPDELNNKRTGYDSRRQLVSVHEVHTSGRFVNSARLGVNRVVATTGLNFISGNAFAVDSSFGGVPGLNAPVVNVTGLTAFTGGIGTPSVYDFHWTSIQAYNDASFVEGTHGIKIGASFERARDNILANSDPGGLFGFNSLSDFLLNRPFSLSAAIPGTISERGLRQTIFAAYIQDQWAFRKNLAINVGVRYEMATVPSEVHNELTVLRILTDATPHLGSPLFANPTLRNVEPRIGFSWDPLGDGKNSVSGGFGIFDVLPLPYFVQFNEVNSAPFAEQGSATGLPIGTFPGGAFQSVASSSDTFRQAYFDPKPPRSYVMQWNLTLQREFSKAFTLTAAYVGSRGLHQPFRVEDADIVLPTLTPRGYVWPRQGDGKRLNLNAGRISAGYWSADSYFHGLEAKAQARLGKATVNLSYTFAKTIDTSSASLVGDEYANSISSPLFFNPRLNRGLADFNIADNLELNYQWELGTPKLAQAFLAKGLGGWQFGGVFDASTGVPFTPVIGGDALGVKSTDASIDVPDLVRGPGCRGPLVNQGSPTNYIKTQCFAFPVPSTRRGNLGRNTLIGPGLQTLDLSLIKNTRIKRVSDSFNVQFRAEFFNVLNRANFTPPLDNRSIFDAVGQSVANAGVITSTQTPSRQIQFALKVIW